LTNKLTLSGFHIDKQLNFVGTVPKFAILVNFLNFVYNAKQKHETRMANLSDFVAQKTAVRQ